MMDKDMMMKMMGKKKEEEGGGDMKKDAKLSVLKELRKMASDMMGDDVKGGMMKKVTVAAPSSEGLKEGLHKAEDMMEGAPEAAEEDEGYDDMTDWPSDLSKYSPEEIEAKIAELQAAKDKMLK